MKLESYTIKATIPTGNYANIQPEITVQAESIEEAHKLAMPHITELYNKYSDTVLKENKNEPVKLKSFNEDIEIDFDPVAHIYSYKGNRYESASTFAGRHVKSFDKQGISLTCSKSWGIAQEDILSLWEGNGKITSGFGTAVHAVLEHYSRYKDLGEAIMENSKSKDVNAALPKHPFLRNLILEFEKIDKIKGKNLPEIFVSNTTHMMCGQIDNLKIIDEKKRICRIQDYKFVADLNEKETLLEPFKELSPTKLSKYQIQLSVYANILEMSGWTVEGLDIFAYSDKWEHYPLEVLKVLN